MALWRIIRLAAWSCWIGIFVLAAVDPENAALAAFFLVAFFPLMIASIIAKSKDPYVKRAKEEKKARRHAENAKLILDHRPVATELIATDEYVQMPGRLGCAAIGGLMGGPAGAALGAYLGKKRATFLVRYASGRIGKETVGLNSARYKELYALLTDEQ